MKKLYGVFCGTKFGMTTNKREAIKAARANKGIATEMLYPHDTHAWDAPTFRICSDVIADFRPEVKTLRPILAGTSERALLRVSPEEYE